MRHSRARRCADCAERRVGMASERKVFMVANAHIDPIWQWELDEGIAASLSTFRSAVDLSEEYDFIFCHNESFLYEWIEKNDPVLFSRICDLVKRGRWKVMGGWYLQPDCNMLSGESFIRQIEHGRRYFMEKFGEKPRIAVNVDSFGHSCGLVQIMAKCGFEGYIIGRPGESECLKGVSDIWWKGLDGSRIRVIRIPSYSTTLGCAAEQIAVAAAKENKQYSLVFWGVGNHGGGPSRKDLADIQTLQKKSEKTEYIHSYPEEFFACLSPQAPEIEKSLHPSMPCCYISQSRIKRMHRQLENLLSVTEKMSAVAQAYGMDTTFSLNALEQAERDLMLAQFHDVLAGTCVKRAEENALLMLSHGIFELKHACIRLMVLLASQEKAPPGTYSFIVFNPHPYPLKCVIENEFMLAAQNWSDYFVDIQMYCEGEHIPSQAVKEDSNIPLDWRKRVAYVATLKPMGVTTFYGVEKRVAGKPYRGVEVNGGFVFKNKFYSAELGTDGKLKQISLSDGSKLLSGPLTFGVYEDDEDTWGIRQKKKERIGIKKGEFRQASREEATAVSGTMSDIAPVRVIESGNVFIKIETVFVYNNSHLLICYTFYREFDYIDISVSLLQQSKNELLKMELPVFSGQYCGEIPFGYEKLQEGGCENVSLRWTGIFSNEYSIAVLNDGVYGSSFEDMVLKISLTRSSAYAGHPLSDGFVLRDDRFFPRLDQGELDFHFRLVFTGKGESLLQKVTTKAQEFNEPPYSLHMMPAGEDEKKESPVLELSNPNVVVTAFRRKGKFFHLHLHNNSDQTAETRIFF